MSSDKTVEGQIVTTNGGGDYLAELDRMNNVIERVVNAAIKATHSGQWCDMQGKPYLTGPGAEVVALRCGVSWKNVTSRKEWREDEGGRSYLYIYEADFVLGHGPFAHTLEAIVGTCSSRDQFIGTNFKDGKDQRALSEVEEGSIMKGAMTNMIVNGVTRVTGIRNMTWEQLAPMGITAGGAARVTFAEGSKGGSQNSGASAAESLEIKWGNAKGKKISEIDDKDLAFYMGRWDEEITKADPDKAKFRSTTLKMLAAGKEEQAKRANAKSGVKPKSQEATFWERLQLLATQQNIPDPKLKEVTKQVLKKTPEEKVDPSTLTEADFKAIADSLEVVAKDIAAAKSSAAGF